MSQLPPTGAPMGFVPQGNSPGGAKQSNGVAIAALIFGILICIPFLGIISVPLGIAGVRKTKNPQVGGKGLAITGLILGLLNLIGWVSFCGMIYSGYRASIPSRAPAQQFILDMSNNKLAAAQANAALSPKEIADLYTSNFKDWGAFQSIQWQMSFKFGTNASTANGVQSISTLVGTATFANGTHVLTIIMVDKGAGWKVQALSPNQ